MSANGSPEPYPLDNPSTSIIWTEIQLLFTSNSSPEPYPLGNKLLENKELGELTIPPENGLV